MKQSNGDEASAFENTWLILAFENQRGQLALGINEISVAIEQQTPRDEQVPRPLKQRKGMPSVACFMDRLLCNDRVESSKVRGPRRLAEVSDDERHAAGEVAYVLDRDFMHRLRPIESRIGGYVATEQDLASELTGTRAKLQDAERVLG